MRIFKGIAASEGLAKGKALVHHHASMAAEKQHILSDGVAGELEKFRTALASAKRLLEEHNTTDIAKDSREILETHMLMLEDPEYIQQIEDYIRTNLVCSQWAVDSVTSNMVNLLEATGDELLRERAVDFRDVSLHLIDAIKGKGERRMEHLDEDVVLIADILMPSEIFSMDKTHILGISLDGGGRASHVAILVRAFNIPTVLATNGASKTVTDGEEVIVDGIYGEVFIRPDHTVSQMLDERFNLWQEHEVELHKMVELPTTTTDGHSMLLKANIQTTSEMEAAKACGASGIGLFRSEFLFMESLENPSEERQFAVYRQVLEAMAPKPVTIRTIDIGGDKMVSGLGIDEKNPILGWRAVRFCLSRKDIFTVQLRALLRASVYGKLQIMFPMISGVEELNAVLHLLEHVKDECRRESIPFDPDVKVGTMIEVPSAALCADILAKKVDFFSIGTNDLIQYTIAVDRGNEKIAYLYQPFHPGVLRSIRMIIQMAHQNQIPVSLCGEMASDPLCSVLLAGMGLDELSMGSQSLLQVRKILRSVSYEEAKSLADHVLGMDSYLTITTYIREWMHDRFDHFTTI
ncbi:MAG: phosphoenolpyruvate--protein phosphotransferase [Sphaerochaeta sp.]|uniref:phosphoenolpyruvate--protein phosphotransferase n=1 Tax=Sphaerochaeta sp. TaxID=1972642 RepID=UPI002971F501|nr:phosphoenolpyruvate--protein phosphotransferase [uncultured Sphaerochaeta sp.]MDD3058645.1 phosphoenolpyruvate--protein phosphotransferase [Sphaerochaeta sp.]MDD3929432.1 phosphoenolpyruvate--protein phosphotransferase [Sphaerochaeta sp.]